jgi:hypothetical protein
MTVAVCVYCGTLKQVHLPGVVPVIVGPRWNWISLIRWL